MDASSIKKIPGRRRERPSKGAWLLQRERFQIDTGPAPLPWREAVPAARIVRRILAGVSFRDADETDTLAAAWPGIVGAAVAAHARPASITAGTLTVHVDTSAWLSELSRWSRDEILRKVNTRAGSIPVRRIVFRLDPDGPAR